MPSPYSRVPDLQIGHLFPIKDPEWNNNPYSNKTEDSFHKSHPTYHVSHTEILLNPAPVFFSSELDLCVVKTRNTHIHFELLKDS